MSADFERGAAVWSIDGRAGIYVAPVDGQHAVQPIFDTGDGEDGQWAEGIELWHSVHSAPPKPKLDAEIAAAEAKLSKLRESIRDAQDAQRQAEREHHELMKRLALHESLNHLADLLDGKVTHYLVSDKETGWRIVAADEFFTLRTHYNRMSLQLWADINGKGQRVNWRFAPSLERPDEATREVYPCMSFAEAHQKLTAILHKEMENWAAVAARDGYGFWGVDRTIKVATALGVPILPAMTEAVRARKLRDATKELEKKRAELQAAQAAVASIDPTFHPSNHKVTEA